MARSKSSRRWLDRHVNDSYVARARQLGYRSRAAFKLLALQEKDRILMPGDRVVDLGAAPGGWSQVAVSLTGSSGQVIAVDRLAMDPLPGVVCVTGDFLDEAVMGELERVLAGAPVDVVLSDMAPNISGVAVVDQARATALGEMALDCAKRWLKPGGNLVIKAFQGAGFDGLLWVMRQMFRSVVVRKPLASRSASRECYLVGRRFLGDPDAVTV
ncbi:RlmE family RNA methyltransferase [Thioalkalicoccus limnaeus]|uniref:Ribosomal RNA large subunit methyltransferase E n=1 Tax=Thioalkalicoccus limnaeus TaxID=120681 RepID=A0ABV4BJ65_9GAMM